MRDVQQWILATPRSLPRTSFGEAPTPGFVKRHLRMSTELVERGRNRYTGTLAQRNALAREAAGYTRQALHYADAAELVSGSSAALLHYYAVLNLAKTELLVTNSPDIVGKPVHHGLSYAAGGTSSIAGDSVKVLGGGVFPMLYKKRMNRSLAPGTKLPVSRLLQLIPELGWELEELGMGRTLTGGLLFVAASTGDEAFSACALNRDSPLLECKISRRAFLRHFKATEPPAQWKDIFAVSRRATLGLGFYESRDLVSFDSVDGNVGAALGLVVRAAATALDGYAHRASTSSFDAILAASMYRSKELLLSPDLARYALMFYVSSLVRYRPSKVDPSTQGVQSWLLDAFTDQAALPILIDALCGIDETDHTYAFEAAIRT